MSQTIGILTSGGNAPAMNNAIIAICKAATVQGMKVILIHEGFKGIIDKNFHELNLRYLNIFNTLGNTMIYSSRYPEFKNLNVKKNAIKILKDHKIDVLIAIGGDGTYQGAYSLVKLGQKVITLPGTIDNDVASTDYTIGYDTCLNNIVRSIDSIIDSFDSHQAICFVEVMGRTLSDLAIDAALATQAQAIITKANVFKLDDFEKVANKTWQSGQKSCTFIITENIYGKNGLPTLQELAKSLEKRLNRMVRVDILGYIQRGGTPSANDRVLATKMGYEAVGCIVKKHYNKAICITNNKIKAIDLKKAIDTPKKQDQLALAKQIMKSNQI